MSRQRASHRKRPAHNPPQRMVIPVQEIEAIVEHRNAYEITSRFDCALGHATCLLGCSENSKGNAAWAITGKT